MDYISLPINKKKAYAEVKRLLESLDGDPETRALARLGRKEKKLKFNELGICFEPEDINPLWNKYKDLEKKVNIENTSNYPLLANYEEQIKQYIDRFDNFIDYYKNTKIESFNKWRSRIFKRAVSETGGLAKVTFQPLFAYELSKGCSVGCWFCALSPGKFQGYFPYSSENARFWRRILETGQEIFGQSSCLAMLYHATEPFDNPDYFKFIDDFQSINHFLPQTTTAVPLRDLNLTKEMLRRRNKSLDIMDRMSVLSLKILKRIHREFTPLELINVSLVLQNQEASRIKANSGRVRSNHKKIKDNIKKNLEIKSQNELLEPTTIECVHGFIINLFDSSVKLISPCKASNTWPCGYRVHFQRTFRDINEYKAILQECIEKYAPHKPASDLPICFRKDLEYESDQNGFTLTSPYFKHELTGKNIFTYLGKAIYEGNKNIGDIGAALSDQGFCYFNVLKYIQLLFERGLLADEIDQNFFHYN